MPTSGCFLISGAAPPAHFIGGYGAPPASASPPMYFRLGGGTIKGVSKPGWIVWSRVYVEDGEAQVRHRPGRGRRTAAGRDRGALGLTTPQWPIMHAVLQGVSRDQMMARHKSNHIQVAYAPGDRGRGRALFAKAAAMAEPGAGGTVCGRGEGDLGERAGAEAGGRGRPHFSQSPPGDVVGREEARDRGSLPLPRFHA